MRRLVVGVLGAGLLAALGWSALAWAASLSAPSSVPVGGRVVVHASGLVAGRYGLFLTKTAFQSPAGHESLECVGRAGSLHTVAATVGSAVFSGTLPRTLTCRFGAGEVSRRLTVSPGRGYAFLLASPEVPGAFDPTKSFLRRRVKVVAAG